LGQGVVVDSKARTWLGLVAACAFLLLAGIQLQNLMWSTARVENHSGRPLTGVSLHLGRDSVELGALPPNKARFVRLPAGEASLQVQFSAGGATFTQCNEYVEKDMFYVLVVIGPNLMADCQAQLNAPFRRFMLWEMIR
jgi:hypothetical protein